MIYLYIVLTLVLIMQIITTVYFGFVMINAKKQILDVYEVIPFLRKLQEENRIFINGDHGIKFEPTFNAAIDKERTILKIDLAAVNTRWVINDPEILKSIEESNQKDIDKILDERIKEKFNKTFEEKSNNANE